MGTSHRESYGEVMTRKDYVKIAEVIATAWMDSQDTRESLASDFADMLEADNPNFNRDRFLKAAGVRYF